MMRRFWLAALVAREWIGPPPRVGMPGRQVTLRVGHTIIERTYNGEGAGLSTPPVITGERLRRAGYEFRMPNESVRLMVRWPWGSLLVYVADAKVMT